MAITTNISQFPAAPNAGTDTPEEFSNKADAFVAHQADTYVTEVNTWAGQANTTQSDVNINAQNAALSETNADNSAIAASGSASGAGNSASAALASENAASISETNALQSEQDALASEEAAALSASNALASENAAALSETNAEAAKESAEAAANYQGEWNVGTAYLVGESVSHSDTFYYCKINNTGLNPSQNPGEWQLGGAATTYAGLTDVNLAGLANNSSMRYETASGLWKVSTSIQSDITGLTAQTVINQVVMTQSAYDLITPDPSTVYLLLEG